MEAAITERRLVGPREMPTPEDEGVRGPRYGSTRQGLPDPAHGRATHEEAPPPGGVGRPQEQEESEECGPVPPSQRRSARVATHTKKAMVPTRNRPNASFSTVLTGSRYTSDSRPDNALKRISNARIIRLRIAS